MPRKNHLLMRPVSDAVRVIVRVQLKDARRGLEGLDADDAGALHRFRVALRRTRTTLDAYRPWLENVRAKDRRRLRDLMRSTGAARDAEVLLPRLVRMARGRRPDARAAIAAIRRRLRHAARRFHGREREQLVAKLRRTRRSLRRQLESNSRASEPFGRALGSIVTIDAGHLDAQLSRLRFSDDPTDVHTLRLTTKRLRYLLEPLAPEQPDAAAVLTELQRLQRSLGTLHDLDVLAALLREESGHGPVLDTRLSTKRERHARALRARWGDGRDHALVRALEELAWILQVAEPGARRSPPHPAEAARTARRATR